MEPTEVRHCCNPFKNHRKTIVVDLRKVTSGFAEKWPSLISAGQYICCACRKRFYHEVPETVGSAVESANCDTGPKDIEGERFGLESCINMSMSPVCNYCGIGGGRENELGSLHTSGSCTIHYFCLLFASGLPQNGEDEEGILGFLLPDIQKELNRGRKLHCTFCGKKGATIGCSEKKCRRSYHFACGLKHHALFKFTGDFRSYCQHHREYQKGKGLGQKLECPICMDEFVADPKTAVWAPCCNKTSWFHKTCIQQLALSAGYFFKCPLCNDKDIFAEEMQNFGIYVPEKDASWELEPNAYSELERPVRCDAPKCKCPDGRKRDDIGTRWEVILCFLCGASGIHVSCGSLGFTTAEWNCPLCTSMLSESVKRMQQEVRERRLKERKKREKDRVIDKEEEIDKGDEEEGRKLRIASCSTATCESPLARQFSQHSAEENSVLETQCEDKAWEVGCNSLTPKRKLEVLDRTEETPLKRSCLDFADTYTKLTYASDSDEEIDIELGEYQVPPHIVIRELEESGEELTKQLKKLKDYAIRAQERMNELRLTEMEIVKMAKESTSYKHFPLDKAMVIKFFRYNLPLDKMIQTMKVIRAIYSVREAVVVSANSSTKKKPQGSSIKRRALRSKCCDGTPAIAVSLSKSALLKTMASAAGVTSVIVGDQSEEGANEVVDVQQQAEDTHQVKMIEDNESISSVGDLHTLQSLPCEENADARNKLRSSTVMNKIWNSPCDSPNLRLHLSFSSVEGSPVPFDYLNSPASDRKEMSPQKSWKIMNKENDFEKLDVIKEEIDMPFKISPKQPLEDSTASALINIMPVESTPTSSSSNRIHDQQSHDDRL